jgi:ankyrin repeat protein
MALSFFPSRRVALLSQVERLDSAALASLLDHSLHLLGTVDVMDSATGDTPLLLACRLGHAHVVRVCLSRGAKNDPHPSFGQTALQVRA